MTGYPNNSISAKQSQRNDADPPEKKVEKVVSGNVKTRKKSEVKKFAGIFIPDDTTSVKSYILMDVVVPGIKNALAEVVSILLFGETGHTGGKKSGSKISYQRYYDERRDDRRDRSRRTSTGYEFDDIIIESRGEADMVLEQLEEIIATYGVASVAELYDLVGISGRFTDNKYGWTDLRNAKVVRGRDGYILQLPRALPID